MKKAIFISDLHLGVRNSGIPDREEILIAKLKQWKDELSHLILVGDVFEFWMEYKFYVPKHHFRVLSRLRELTEAGVQVHYVAGNHDFHLESFFREQLGVQTSRKLMIEIQNRKLLCLHGDGLARGDWKYRIARKILHNPLNIFLFKLLHPDLGMKLAQKVGGVSRKAGKKKHTPTHEYEQAARRLLNAYQRDLLVMGHTHQAIQERYPEGEFVNTGQWLFELNYAELENGQIRLVTEPHGLA